MSNVKVIVLLPTRDNEGSPLYPEVNNILEMVLDTFGGYTADETWGAYTFKHNDRVVKDDCVRFFVIIDQLRVPELQVMVARWGRDLRQETMYFEVSPANVEFIKAAR